MVVRIISHQFVDDPGCAHIGAAHEFQIDELFEDTIDRGAVEFCPAFLDIPLNIWNGQMRFGSSQRFNHKTALNRHPFAVLAKFFQDDLSLTHSTASRSEQTCPTSYTFMIPDRRQ